MGCAGSKEARQGGQKATKEVAGVSYVPSVADVQAENLELNAVAGAKTAQESKFYPTSKPQYIERDLKHTVGSRKCLGHMSVGLQAGQDLAAENVYCKLLIREFATNALVALSGVKRGSSSPKFDDRFIFNMHDPWGDLIVQVLEVGHEDEVFLGECTVSIKDMVYFSLCKKPVRWYTLFNSVKDGVDMASTGRLQLSLDFVPLKNSRFELGIMEGRKIVMPKKDDTADVYVRAKMGDDVGQTHPAPNRGGHPAWVHVIALPTQDAQDLIKLDLLRRTVGKGDDVVVGSTSVVAQALLDPVADAAAPGVHWLQLKDGGSKGVGEICVDGVVKTSDEAKEEFLRSLGLEWPKEKPPPPPPVVATRAFNFVPATPPPAALAPVITPTKRNVACTHLVCRDCGQSCASQHECEEHTRVTGHSRWAMPTLTSLIDECAGRMDVDVVTLLSKCDQDKDEHLNGKEMGALARKVYPKAAESQIKDMVAILGGDDPEEDEPVPISRLAKIVHVANAFTEEVARPCMAPTQPPPMSLDGAPPATPEQTALRGAWQAAESDFFILVDERARTTNGGLPSLYSQWDADGDKILDPQELADAVKAVFPRAAPEHRLRFKAALEAEGIDGLTLDDFRQATRASRAFQKAFMLDARHFAGRDLCALIREYIEGRRMSLRDLFLRCDMDRDEKLDRDEFRTLVSVVNPLCSEENLDDIKHNLDADNDACVTYRELEVAVQVASAFDKSVGHAIRTAPRAHRKMMFDSPGGGGGMTRQSGASPLGPVPVNARIRASPDASPGRDILSPSGEAPLHARGGPARVSRDFGDARGPMAAPLVTEIFDSPLEETKRRTVGNEGNVFSAIDIYCKRYDRDPKNLFDDMDTDENGSLNPQELRGLCSTVCPQAADADLADFEKLVGRDGAVDMTYHELEKAILLDKIYYRGLRGELMAKPGGPDVLHMIEAHMERTRTRLLDIFRFCDKDHDNMLNSIETKTFLDMVYPQRHASKSSSMARRFTLLVDRDGDGCITYKDLQLAMKGYKSSGTELHSPLNPRKGATVDASDIFEKLGLMLNGNKDKARQMYEGLDRDGSGLLERRELYVLMKRLIPGATQKELKMTLAELQAAHARSGGEPGRGITYEEMVVLLDDLQRTSTKGGKRTDLKRINGLAMTPREREEEDARLANFYNRPTKSSQTASGVSGGGGSDNSGSGGGGSVTSKRKASQGAQEATSRPKSATPQPSPQAHGSSKPPLSRPATAPSSEGRPRKLPPPGPPRVAGVMTASQSNKAQGKAQAKNQKETRAFGASPLPSPAHSAPPTVGRAERAKKAAGSKLNTPKASSADHAQTRAAKKVEAPVDLEGVEVEMAGERGGSGAAAALSALHDEVTDAEDNEGADDIISPVGVVAMEAKDAMGAGAEVEATAARSAAAAVAAEEAEAEAEAAEAEAAAAKAVAAKAAEAKAEAAAAESRERERAMSGVEAALAAARSARANRAPAGAAAGAAGAGAGAEAPKAGSRAAKHAAAAQLLRAADDK